MAHPIFQFVFLTILLMRHVSPQPVSPLVCPTGSLQVSPFPSPFPPGCVEPPSQEPQGDTGASNGSQYHITWQFIVSLVFFIICIVMAWILWRQQQLLYRSLNRFANYYWRWTRRWRRNTQRPPPSPTGPTPDAIALDDIPTDRHVGDTVEEEAHLPRVPAEAHR